MPKAVDDAIGKIMRSGKSRSEAIAIAKSRGLIRQSGRQLKAGPKLRSRGRKG